MYCLKVIIIQVKRNLDICICLLIVFAAFLSRSQYNLKPVSLHQVYFSEHLRGCFQEIVCTACINFHVKLNQ